MQEAGAAGWDEYRVGLLTAKKIQQIEYPWRGEEREAKVSLTNKTARA